VTDLAASMTPDSASVTRGALAAGAFLRGDLRARLAAEERLAPAAARSSASRGRRAAEPPDRFRTPYEVDRDRILHSKSFRRLKHKTQVFIGSDPAGGNDHVVTRLTHTLQVTQVARALAAGLGLNEPLAEAVALGHDVGHPPFGHAGEEVLDALVPGGWHHAAQSVRIYDVLEPRNLTWEVRDGLRAHTWRVEPPPATPEAQCVRFADRIAYLLHDALDALRTGVLHPGDLPAEVLAVLGPAGGGWIGRLVESVIDESCRSQRLAMAPEMSTAMDELRSFLFARVYHGVRTEAERAMVEEVVRGLVSHLLTNPQLVPSSYRDHGANPLRQAVDYVAGMTDRYALRLHRRLGVQ
jgi:dGTPase